MLFLLIELSLLIYGWYTHRRLHHAYTVHQWAKSRLLAEIATSFKSAGNIQTYIHYPFELPVPHFLHPMLRTMNILHMRSIWKNKSADWKANRDRYVQERLLGSRGQIPYYGRKLPKVSYWHRIAQWTFLVCSVLAILATGAKFTAIGLSHMKAPPTATHASGQAVDAHTPHESPDTEATADAHHADAPAEAHAAAAHAGEETAAPHGSDGHGEDGPVSIKTIFGIAGVLLPVFAVAALSLAAANDLEARIHTYTEMIGFLENQLGYIRNASSEREFVRLFLETEGRLLGETVNWYSRRSYTGVA